MSNLMCLVDWISYHGKRNMVGYENKIISAVNAMCFLKTFTEPELHKIIWEGIIFSKQQ
jgi:hypothetical protein